MAVSLFISAVNAVAAVLFLAAAQQSFSFYQDTREIFDYWLLLSAGSLLAAIWTGFVTVEWIGIAPEAFDAAQSPLIGSVAVVFALAAQATVSMYKQ